MNAPERPVLSGKKVPPLAEASREEFAERLKDRQADAFKHEKDGAESEAEDQPQPSRRRAEGTSGNDQIFLHFLDGVFIDARPNGVAEEEGEEFPNPRKLAPCEYSL